MLPRRLSIKNLLVGVIDRCFAARLSSGDAAPSLRRGSDVDAHQRIHDGRSFPDVG